MDHHSTLPGESILPFITHTVNKRLRMPQNYFSNKLYFWIGFVWKKVMKNVFMCEMCIFHGYRARKLVFLLWLLELITYSLKYLITIAPLLRFCCVFHCKQPSGSEGKEFRRAIHFNGVQARICSQKTLCSILNASNG